MSSTVLVGPLDVPSATQRTPLGTKCVVLDPDTGCENEWIYVKNGAATAAIGVVMQRPADATTYTGVVKAAVDSIKERLVGVTQVAFAANYYGWILRNGIGSVIADTAGVTKTMGIKVGNAVAGTVDETSATVADANAFGWAITGATATNLLTAKFACPG